MMLGLSVTIVAGGFLTLFVTVFNFRTLGLFVGPLKPDDPTIVTHAGGDQTALLGIPPDWNMGHIGSAYWSLGDIQREVFVTGFSNLGLAIIPFLEILGWCFMLYILSTLVEPGSRVGVKEWVTYSVAGWGVLVLSIVGALLAVNISTPEYLVTLGGLGTMGLAFGTIGAVMSATALGLYIRDVFSGYFTSQIGATSVGSRIAEMKSLGKATFETVGGRHQGIHDRPAAAQGHRRSIRRLAPPRYAALWTAGLRQDPAHEGARL
jgi:hypothetical protein